MPEDTSLSGRTATEWLIWNSDDFLVTGNADADSSRGGVNLYTRYNYLPDASFQVDAGLSEDPSATLSVGSKLLNFESRFERARDGDALTNTVSGELGPVSAFYSETSQPGNLGFKQRAYGGKLDLGLGQLYGRRNRSNQDVVDPSYAPYFRNTRFDQQTDTFGASGSWPFLGGSLFGDINRQSGTGRFPQHISQDARPTGQFPNVTNIGAGYRGRVGPGDLSLQGNLRNVRGVGVEPSMRGDYIIDNPLGLGGQFRATGSYKNPIDGKTAAEIMLGYRNKF